MNTMQAWLLNQQQIRLGRKTRPSPTGATVLVKNRAIGLNPVDWKLIDGRLGHFDTDTIPGVDGMGVIAAVGDAASHLRVGTRVAYHTDLRKDGSFSEYTLVDARALLPVPDGLSDVAAAAFPCPVLTAWQALQKLPAIAGKTILVNGAGGAVGSAICQLLAQRGAKLYATASPRRHAFLAQAGVVQAVDYRDERWAERFAGMRFYAAFDTVSGDSARGLAAMLEYYGHLVCIQDRLDASPVAPFSSCISLHEIALAAQHGHGSDAQWSELVAAAAQLLQQVQQGKLVLPAIQTVAFEQLDSALARLKANNDGSKYVAVFA